MSARFTAAFVVAAALVSSACDRRAQPLEPESAALAHPASPTLDVTTSALVTNTIQFEARCGSGVSGTVRPVVHLVGGALDVVVLDCSHDTQTYPAEGVTGAHVAYGFLVGASCDLSETFAVEDFPSRSTCTVNGTDVGGRPLATVTMRYVKD